MVRKKYFMTALLIACAITTTMEAKDNNRKDAHVNTSDIIAFCIASGIRATSHYLYIHLDEKDMNFHSDVAYNICKISDIALRCIIMKMFWSSQANKKKSKISYSIDAGICVLLSLTSFLFETNYAQRIISKNLCECTNIISNLCFDIVFAKNLWELTQDDAITEESAEKDTMISI